MERWQQLRRIIVITLVARAAAAAAALAPRAPALVWWLVLHDAGVALAHVAPEEAVDACARARLGCFLAEVCGPIWKRSTCDDDGGCADRTIKIGGREKKKKKEKKKQ
jgi:hypothetical protein